MFAHTVTISISDYTENCSTIPDLLAEAMELIKLRMIKGGGGITLWREEAEGSHKYIYPANSERRILEFPRPRDPDSIDQASWRRFEKRFSRSNTSPMTTFCSSIISWSA